MHISGLCLYPVKSLGAVAVREAPVDDLGLRGDRRWMLVDADGRFLTQREHAALALGRVALGDGAALTLSVPALPPLRVTPPPADAPRERVTIFGDVVDAVPAAPEAHAWASTWLGAPTRLVYMPDDARRAVDPRYAGPDDRTAFTDGYPVLVASTASLDDLNARLVATGATPVGMDRFRPNIVVAADEGEALAPYAEDDWRALRLGDGVRLAVVKPCARCVVTTIDQESAGRSREPLRTLAEYRRAGTKVLFAQNAVVRAGGVLRIGDAVTAATRSD
ncbi:MAG TPA: MOSC N-terminal beta barrel domain-containing protein [Gemmatirosa sp.]